MSRETNWEAKWVLDCWLLDRFAFRLKTIRLIITQLLWIVWTVAFDLFAFLSHSFFFFFFLLFFGYRSIDTEIAKRHNNMLLFLLCSLSFILSMLCGGMALRLLLLLLLHSYNMVYWPLLRCLYGNHWW